MKHTVNFEWQHQHLQNIAKLKKKFRQDLSKYVQFSIKRHSKYLQFVVKKCIIKFGYLLFYTVLIQMQRFKLLSFCYRILFCIISVWVVNGYHFKSIYESNYTLSQQVNLFYSNILYSLCSKMIAKIFIAFYFYVWLVKAVLP